MRDIQTECNRVPDAGRIRGLAEPMRGFGEALARLGRDMPDYGERVLEDPRRPGGPPHKWFAGVGQASAVRWGCKRRSERRLAKIRNFASAFRVPSSQARRAKEGSAWRKPCGLSGVHPAMARAEEIRVRPSAPHCRLARHPRRGENDPPQKLRARQASRTAPRRNPGSDRRLSREWASGSGSGSST